MKLLKNRTTYDATIDDIMRHRAQIDRLKPYLDLADDVVGSFTGKLNIYASCGWHSGSVRGALVIINDVKHIREATPVCRRVLLELRNRWLKFSKPKIEDYPELKRRTYNYGDIQVLVMLDWSGAMCSFEIVGHEQKPVYKLKCTEPATPIEDEV